MKMGRLSRTCAVVVTAIMTLIAGLPHFHCRCPNGQVKPFCLDSLINFSSHCCCQGACCSAQAPPRGKPPQSPDASSALSPKHSRCCCATSDAEPAPGPRTCVQASIPGCQKTLIHAQDAKTSRGIQAPARDLTVNPLVALPLLSCWQPAIPSPNLGRVAESHGLPPPTDLVTVLQHFLI